MLASHTIGQGRPVTGNARYIALAKERTFLTILYDFDYFLAYIRGEDFCVLASVIH